MGETYYDVLGVDQDATQDEIRTAYRDRVLETHPDHNDDPDAATQFKRVKTAESVLADEAERARYDRLGHDSYTRFAKYSGESDETDDSTQSDSQTTRERTTGRSRRSRRRTRRNESRSHGNTQTSSHTSQSGGSSHHARQRSRRRRAAQRSAGGWPFETDDQATDGGGSTAHAAGQTATGAGQTMGGEESADESTGFSYTVHGWEGEVELESDTQQLDQSTVINLASIAVVYPVLVYGSLSPSFSVILNAIVAICGLLLVGYTLTFPKIAIGIFGTWSLLIPVGLVVGPFEPLSIYGVLAIGCCWVPLGYAVAVWWVLRP